MGQLAMAEKCDAPLGPMQGSRFYLLLAALTVLVGVYLLVQFFEWEDENDVWAKYYKIQPGMNIEEVKSLFGPSSGSPWSSEDGSVEEMTWKVDHSTLYVRFMADGTVTSKNWGESSPSPTSKTTLGDYIKRFLKRIGL
jgi:hypothetical protein